ncbi:helix-turn-helix transcriptional regulator [Mycobacterium simiae]|uniref:Helix-turn-helix transcriptional regulator n=1 Tax=Mycobacterium simiae TaxID=1784 RepID=A0A5B1BVH6_MYCSI|nr:AraC family transcriptional regulator [Mycobacterium simiae]KAA1251343.1 helix-turn-helix transcriptional regulator [Mycobacterium simiae]
MVGYRALDVPEAAHRGMPSAMLTFIVSLDDGVEAADTADALAQAQPNPLVLAGLHMRASHVRQRRGQAGVQLAVHPLASRALFGVPSAELPVTDFDALDVLGRHARDLPERVAAARRWPEAFATVAGHLVDAQRRRDDATVRPEIAHAWHLLERTQGRIPMSTLATRVGISARQLTTLFHREFGRSPKTVSMLMRFQHATTRIAAAARQHGRVDLAAIAANTGYCDQAHLTREFGRFAGVPPRAWLAAEFRNIQDGGHSFGAQWDHDNFESDRLVDTAGS